MNRKKRITQIFAAVTAALILAAALPGTAFARDELKNTDPLKYYIWLDTVSQVVTVYERDDNGEYTKIVRRFICSSGDTRETLDENGEKVPASPTPSGIWKIGARERFGKFAAFGGEYARYWTQIVGGNYFHSIMFSRRDVEHLKSGAFRSLGNAVSHGCVRLYIEDAKWLYYYACPGTTIEVTNTGKSQRDVKSVLKTDWAFKDYDELQKNIYDEPELPNYDCWVVVDKAPVRTGNGSNDRVSFYVEKDQKLEVLQDGEPWCKVKNPENDKEGYILRGYITYEQGVMETKEDADIIKSTVWIYADKDTDSERLTKVPTSTSVKVLEVDEENGWTKIEYWDEQGWLKTKQLTKGWGLIRD